HFLKVVKRHEYVVGIVLAHLRFEEIANQVGAVGGGQFLAAFVRDNANFIAGAEQIDILVLFLGTGVFLAKTGDGVADDDAFRNSQFGGCGGYWRLNILLSLRFLLLKFPPQLLILPPLQLLLPNIFLEEPPPGLLGYFKGWFAPLSLPNEVLLET